MTSHFVWQGFAVGFLAAIPLGPMGMVCVERTLRHGRLSGLVSACGLSLAAAFWCVIAAHGLNSVAGLVAGRETVFTLALGAFLVAAGLLGLRRGGQGMPPMSQKDYGGLAGQFMSSFLGVILNPITFVTMTAVLAILGGIGTALDKGGLAGLAVAAFLGGMTLWFWVTQGLGAMRNHLSETSGARISKALNCGILLLGIVYMVRPFLPDAMG